MTGNLGTCQYMAPGAFFIQYIPSFDLSSLSMLRPIEVLRNESYTESADVYSFGVIVWELVARTPPFHGMQTMQIAFSVNQGMRPPIPSHCPIVLRPSSRSVALLIANTRLDPSPCVISCSDVGSRTRGKDLPFPLSSIR